MGINERQKDDRGLLLHTAVIAAHRAAQKIEWLRYTPSLLIAVAGATFSCLQRTNTALLVISFAWAILSTLLLAPLVKQRSSEAARLQEHFDTHVFDMEWSERGEKVDPERIREFSARFKGDPNKLTDYYADVSDFPPSVAVLLCQRSNVTWDMRLRQRWKNIVTTSLIIWLCLGILYGLIANESTLNLILRWYAPSLAIISLAWEIIHSQRQTIADRSAVKARISSELEWAGRQLSTSQQKALTKACRKIQDDIFTVRSKATRVPKFLYERYRESDDGRMKAAIADMKQDLEALQHP
ncbi:S-4TM family putative pore-forming effector [Streptomyces griseorubiginosus]|uniref:S-4TM family putative pore-forming effector n=1 Tax=Streptomyces griseorubiginosus TaxID=67304 RepID=UPI0036ED8E69